MVEKISSLSNPGKSLSLSLKKAILNCLNSVKTHQKSIGLWAGTIASFLVLAIPVNVSPSAKDEYTIYSAKPPELKEMQSQIYANDSRTQKIDQVFKKYKCPLDGMGSKFVEEADKNNIPWWIVASIAFQESSCGKNTPKIAGEESYNAWGWAVYGDNVHKFDSWAQGTEVVSKYLNNKFFSKGVTEPCAIMRVYTPPSNGEWCKSVSYFGEMIQNYTSD